MPKEQRVTNQSQALRQPLVSKYCASFWCKLRGLAWRLKLAEDRGLLLVMPQEGRAGAAIHMLGMFFHLSIVWLDADFTVVDVKKAFAWRSILFPKNTAKYILECSLSRFDEFRLGDQLVFETL